MREFVQKKLIPRAHELEKLGYPPKALWIEMAQMGYLGISYPEKWGGQEAPFAWSAVFLEELGKCRMGGLSAALGVHSYIACPYLEKLGTEVIKEEYPVTRLMRDSRVNTIAGGTSEIMCEILGKSLFA